MDKNLRREKVHDPGVNFDSDSSESDVPNNNIEPAAAPAYNNDIGLDLIHNDLHQETESEPESQPEGGGGPQAPNPKSEKCNGAKVNKGKGCEDGKRGTRYTENSWNCPNGPHSGLCWYCKWSQICPVCGDGYRRLPGTGP